MEKNTIVIFGGSFNPPLNSHFSIAQQVLNEYEEVEKIVFIPLNEKHSKKELLEERHRYNMLKLVAEKNSSFMVSKAEIYGEKAIENIKNLVQEEQLNNKNIWILIGSDNLKNIHNWNNAEELISKYTIVIKQRDEDNIEKIIENNVLLNKYKNNFKKINQEIKNNYNSTYVRKMIKKKKNVRYLMPDEVYDYITENKLYVD